MRTSALASVIGSLLLVACSGGGGGGGSGGAGPGSGGRSTGSGGAPDATGGSGVGTGGAPSASGGAPGATGGSVGSGGAPASSGGAPAATGGNAGGMGGAPAATGGNPGGMGGAPAATGGRGGNSGSSGGAGGGSADMSFFVTSRGMGNGGNLNGLDGADAFCKMLAQAVSPALGAKTWRAYLSTTTVNARDRIGPGPWRNARGTIIANTVAQLHDQAAGGMLDSTWPTNNVNIPLDETGAMVPASGGNANVHDILTGSNADGTVGTVHCNNWTSSATTDSAWNGHSNRTGGGTRPTSWNSAHMVGCGQPGAGMNFQQGTVSSGGGRGSFYCFATP